MPTRLERAAPAKVNLALHVTGRRADGYHLLESLVVFTRYGDQLHAAPAEHDTFSLAGPYGAQVPRDADNLVLRARDLLRRHFGVDKPVALTLEKNLPVASGIGGGSSDAAATLHLLARHWHVKAGHRDLAKIALALGADVPMCLAARPLLAHGIGEALEPVRRLPALPLLLVNPGQMLATPDVFAALERRENPPLPPFQGGGGVAEIVRWLNSARNDLEAPALMLMPEIGIALKALRSEGALIVRMSGSGATCFGIFETEGQAQAAEKAIGSRRPEWFVQATITTASVEAIHNG
ncbi:4-(cytidine 5'-diphospho)-2-C-methyl-D-erythritol kinase [Chelativorans salis]|uniref:4-diphosphocytidyl-2-C-methyl-D-erythritol kinase n=1 Tax=Chelativorans salis TaxID=2978478 RepID=A0ABT2LGJ2_9HYPH|nr:4-(cytidine 5'-diphospho)-2-C-methyl-D-erythritol kinase [Chelativorans sp. EGI FJ00035]MCT7373616.1 4-(cytidine 5'-diphospho)-2-C-methyl-D-erythritol kinase [Chelativorans sp. EGI FJ00035]